MTYNELKELISRSRFHTIDEFAEEIKVTRQGLRKMLDAGTISLNNINKISEVLRISPDLFFNTGGRNVYLSSSNVQNGNGNKIVIESKDKEIELLREQLMLKDEIIKMLREKINENV